MPATQKAVDATIRGLYEAALQPQSWPKALDALRQLFDGAASVVFLQDMESGEVPLWFSVGTEAGEREYIEHIKDVNPRARYSASRPPGVVVWDYRVLPEEAMRRDVFYDWLQRVQDYRYFIGSRMFVQGGRSAFTSIEWSRRHGHVEREAIRLYRQILPHIEQALHLTLSQAQAQARAATFEALLEEIDCGTMVLDRRGRVLSMNAMAEAIIGSHDGLAVERQRLRAGKAADQRALDRAVMAAIATAVGDSLAPPSDLALARRSGAVPYSVSVIPLPVEPLPGLTARPAAAVLIRDAASCSGPSGALLGSLYGLSLRETQLAAALGSGLTLRQAADRLAIAHNTARVHLRGVFLKTGVHSQIELARLLTNLPRQSASLPTPGQSPSRLIQSH